MDSLTLDALKTGNGECYCVPHSTDYGSIFPEDECITNCIINYVGQQNADVPLWLTESFLTKNDMFFSSTCLKAFIAFLLNADHSFAEKDRVVAILRDQLEEHPSCAAYTSQTYQSLFLEPEEIYFKKLTSLDYLLSELQNQISSTNVCFSASRITRVTRRVVSYLENSSSNSSTEQKAEFMERSSRAKDIIFVLLDMLTEILTHDLRATLNRGESPTKCILAKLIFKGSSSTLSFQPMTQKLFVAYKCCTSAEERRQVAGLLELAATLAWHVDHEQNEANLLRLGSCCERFVSDFLIAVFEEEEIRESYSMDKITSLNLIWLRYHAAHYVLEKISKREKFSGGIKDVVNELLTLLKMPQNSRENQSTESSSHQNSNSGGIDEELIAACRADDLETLKRLSEADIDLNNALGDSGQSALHIAAQNGSVDCVSFLLKYKKKIVNPRLEDNEGNTPLMYAERGGYVAIVDMLNKHTDKMTKRIQKLTPSLCKIFMIVTDTMIKMLDEIDLSDRKDAIQDLEQLLSLIKELSQNEVPKEVISWAKVLSKIEIVD